MFKDTKNNSLKIRQGCDKLWRHVRTYIKQWQLSLTYIDIYVHTSTYTAQLFMHVPTKINNSQLELYLKTHAYFSNKTSVHAYLGVHVHSTKNEVFHYEQLQ